MVLFLLKAFFSPLLSNIIDFFWEVASDEHEYSKAV